MIKHVFNANNGLAFLWKVWISHLCMSLLLISSRISGTFIHNNLETLQSMNDVNGPVRLKICVIYGGGAVEERTMRKWFDKVYS